MSDRPIELCCVCDDATGRAGRCEDSLYTANGDRGPFCESCYRGAQYIDDELRAEVNAIRGRMEQVADERDGLAKEAYTLRAEISDARSLAYNLDPDRMEPPDMGLCEQINHLGEHIARLRAIVARVEDVDQLTGQIFLSVTGLTMGLAKRCATYVRDYVMGEG